MASTLQLNWAFGYKGAVADSLAFFDDNIVIYPVGNNVVIYDTVRKTQKFINSIREQGTAATVADLQTEASEGITAMAVSPNTRFIAVAERGPTSGAVFVYDLYTQKKKKVLSTTESSSREYVSVAFSADSRQLLTQAGEPDWALFMWNMEKSSMEKSAPMAVYKPAPPLPVSQCSFHPSDPNVFCVTGSGVVKFFRMVNNQIKPTPASVSSLSKRENQNCLCHAWVAEERAIVGTDGGDLLLYESSGELKTVLNHSPGGNRGVHSLLPTSKGFLAGGPWGVYFFEKTEDKDYYKNVAHFEIGPLAANPGDATIQRIVLSPQELHLMVASVTNQIYTMPLQQGGLDGAVQLLKAASASNKANGLVHRPTQALPSKFRHLTHSNHSAAITGMDLCIRKPLIATCGQDKSIRIWNYRSNTLETCKTFTEDVFSIALHPSGLQVLVGFSDKLRLMNLLLNDISMVTDFDVKACRELRFSNGGQYFAAASGSASGTTVHIFNTYSFEPVANLRAHTGKVKSVYWSNDDSKLITAGLDGAVYEWQLKDGKRTDHIQKTCLYTSALILDDNKTIFGVGSDKKVKEIVGSEVVGAYQSNCTITQLAVSHSNKLLYAGTEMGTLRLYRLPMSGGEMHETIAHAAPVSRIRVSHDDGYVFGAGEDGSIYISEVKSKDVKSRKVTDDQLYADLDQVVVYRNDMEEKLTNLESMKQRYDELTMEHEYQLRLKDMGYAEKAKEAEEKSNHIISQWKIKFEAADSEKKELEQEARKELSAEKAKAAKKQAETEERYRQQIVDEVERYQALLRSKEDLQAQYQRSLDDLSAQHERTMMELREQYEATYRESVARLEDNKKDLDELTKEFDETRVQIEDDADREIEQLKHEYDEKLALEKQNSLRLKGENNLLVKKYSNQAKEIETLKEEISNMASTKKQLMHQIHQHMKEITGMKKEIKDRDDTLGDKEMRIFELKKRNQELEKFKFVLDYTITELKKQIEPLNSEIADLKEQIKQMDQELERYHKTTAVLEMTVKELRNKNETYTKENAETRRRAINAENHVKRMRTDIHDLMQIISEPHALKERVRELYQKHVDVRIQEVEVDADIQKEYSRQREYLERSMASLKKQLAKESQKHKSDSLKIRQENVQLISEINTLRRELKQLQAQQKDKEMLFITQKKKVHDSPGFDEDDPFVRTTQSASGVRSGREEEKMIQMQREEIKRLRRTIQNLEAQAKPKSPYTLPSMIHDDSR